MDRPKRKVVGVVSITPATVVRPGRYQDWYCQIEVEEEPKYNRQPLVRKRTIIKAGIDEMDVLKKLLTEGA